jgi:hypothetical protein
LRPFTPDVATTVELHRLSPIPSVGRRYRCRTAPTVAASQRWLPPSHTSMCLVTWPLDQVGLPAARSGGGVAGGDEMREAAARVWKVRSVARAGSDASSMFRGPS